jgi:tRNA A37 threonylcarbamoyladenosine synthetase subunit TsaC/SUA5/YrdC
MGFYPGGSGYYNKTQQTNSRITQNNTTSIGVRFPVEERDFALLEALGMVLVST